MGILHNYKRHSVEDANVVSDDGVNKDGFHVLADEDLEKILGGNLPSAVKKFLPCVKSPDTVSHSVKAARRAEWQKGNVFFALTHLADLTLKKRMGQRYLSLSHHNSLQPSNYDVFEPVHVVSPPGTG